MREKLIKLYIIISSIAFVYLEYKLKYDISKKNFDRYY